MPTRSDFELAADKFFHAAALIARFSSAATSADTAMILRGGSLGRQVPDRIASAVAAAAQCEQEVVRAAEVCVERAAIIAEYEVRLEAYEAAHDSFEAARSRHAARFSAWFLDETGTVEPPGDAPQPPSKPTPPPESWADVRRP